MRKTVLVTGGASGLGKAICLAFAENGYDVMFTYCSSDQEAFLLKEELERRYSVEATCYSCDFSSEAEINRMLSSIEQSEKVIDVLIHNAAVEMNFEFASKTKEEFIHTLEVNLVAPFLISRSIGEKMKSQKHGKIINIASNNIEKTFGDPSTLEYDASKAGLVSLTHNLAKQFAPFVQVNAIAPGWIATKRILELDRSLDGKFMEQEKERILLKRFAKEEDICNLLLFLASEKSDYINSEVITIDGGML